jgi:hypothetical protein
MFMPGPVSLPCRKKQNPKIFSGLEAVPADSAFIGMNIACPVNGWEKYPNQNLGNKSQIYFLRGVTLLLLLRGGYESIPVATRGGSDFRRNQNILGQDVCTIHGLAAVRQTTNS